MRTATATTITVILALALTSCGKSAAEQAADCRDAITATSTKTFRPDACKDLSQDDYNALLMDWALKNSGVIDKDGNVDPDKLLDD
ncbi:hypothetical protein ACFWGL_17095 [Streptomyces sp. NPDC060286]|uniref:hypothetical protein n=1 Tax=unclassified Streptomyces TaxID=2593676 RepID=UPI0035E1A1E3